MRGGSAPWAIAALAAAVLAACGQAPVTNPLPDPDPGPAPVAAALRSFRFPSCINPALPDDCAAAIDGAEVEAVIPFGTGQGCLVAEFEADAERVLVGDREQVSGETPNDYSRPLVYTLVGEDGVPRDYAVHVAGWWADDFDREGSPVVGNGWTEVEPGTTDRAEASIVANALVLEGCTGYPLLNAGVRRDFPSTVSRSFHVTVRFTRQLGGVLFVDARGSAASADCVFSLAGNALSIARGGVTLGSKTVEFDYDAAYTLVASVGTDGLSAAVVDGSGLVQSLDCQGSLPEAGFTGIEIRGGRYFGGYNCLTTVDRVDIASPCCP